ncbi:S1C family serine protease [Mogibacterium diversum]|uniref:S1C family serine protease n=1 Tax=Mogibacterium diversum TaxID=114527 RepID=UPI0026EC13E1|nr:trypsin-like peptidase domain-containing protein [Mogibacterium diversum]
MNDFDHTIPTENDNSNQVDERSDAQDVRYTEVGSNTQGVEEIHEDSNEYWRDDDSIYDVKNVQLPEDTPVKKEWGSYAPENAGDFLPKDGEEPNFVLIDENSNVPAPRNRFARSKCESYAKHAADGSFERSYGKHAAPESEVYGATAYTGQNGSPEAQGAHAYTTGFNGDKPPKHKNPKYVTKRFFIITLIISMMLTSIVSSWLVVFFSNRTPSYKNLSTSSLQSATGGKLTIDEIASKNADAVVEIMTTSGGTSEGAGSGVIVKSNGYIVTNYHVIDGATTIVVRLHSGKNYSASIVGYDEQTDIAVLKIDAPKLNAVTIGRSSKLSVGDLAVVIGNPLGKLGGTVTAGIISAKDRKIELENRTRTLIQTDASINEGNSGGALFNSKGELVGIVVAKGSGTGIEGLGFAIPIDSVASSIDDIIEHGTITGKPMAGISIYDGDVKDKTTGKSTAAVLIAEVNGSNAKAAGLKKGDQIVSVDNEKVSTAEGVISAIQSHRIGETVKLGIIRDGKEMTISVKLQSSAEIKK